LAKLGHGYSMIIHDFETFSLGDGLIHIFFLFDDGILPFA
jgi:hypothetical protein